MISHIHTHSLMLYHRRGSRDISYSSDTPTFYQNDLSMRNTAKSPSDVKLKKLPSYMYSKVHNRLHTLNFVTLLFQVH
jgi:hypothetical protein